MARRVIGFPPRRSDRFVHHWRTPDAAFFKVRTVDGKHYLLRYDESKDLWTLQDDFDGVGLLARTSIELISVEPKAIREAESRIAGCKRCRSAESEYCSIRSSPRSSKGMELLNLSWRNPQSVRIAEVRFRRKRWRSRTVGSKWRNPFDDG